MRDHSLYIAFAPADKPKIALAVIVENAGFGAAAAAPIARLAMDYYLTGKRPDEPAKPTAKVVDPTQPAQPTPSTQPATAKPEVTKPVAKAADTAVQSAVVKTDVAKPVTKSTDNPTQSAVIKTDAVKPVVKGGDPTQPATVKSDTTKPSTPKPVEPNRGAPQ